MSNLELADIFLRYGPAYIERFGDKMLPSHRRALHDIAFCRTDAFGGHIDVCNNPQCPHVEFVYHSCRNRSCPKCHVNHTNQWLEKREAELLPIPYFHVVFTLPKELHDLVRSNQKELLAALMKAAAYSLLKLSQDPKYLGAKPSIMVTLHTWTRAMVWHPHAHCLVSAGGISPDYSQWVPAKYKKYLVPVKALSKIFRAKFVKMARKALSNSNSHDLHDQLPPQIWKKNWVVYSKPTLKGPQKVLKYLARYVHRIAITNNRIISISDQNDKITFQYKDSKTYKTKKMPLQANEFIRRFLQHVLPKGFHKVRFYGLWSPRNRCHLFNIKRILEKDQITSLNFNTNQLSENKNYIKQEGDPQACSIVQLPRCPKCKIGYMVTIERLPKVKRTLGQRAPP
jgi:hypothetical protein